MENATSSSAQIDEGLVLHYDFKDVSGTSVPDKSQTGATAKLVSGAKVTAVGKCSALSLGAGNGYLDMTSTAGKAVKALDGHTISCYYFIDESTDISGAGNFVWRFSTSTATSLNDYPYEMIPVAYEPSAIDGTEADIASEQGKGNFDLAGRRVGNYATLTPGSTLSMAGR